MPRIRTAGVIATMSALALALSGCSVLTAFSPHVESEIFDTAKDMKAAKTSTFGSPTFVPDDATIIRVDYDTQGKGAILTYTSKTHFKAGTCTKAVKMQKPEIQDSWWPATGVPEQGVSCPGGWTAFAAGDQIYAATLSSPAK